MDGRLAGWAFLALAAGLCWAVAAKAEFYKYTDRSGQSHYVDEVWKIPEEYRGQAGRYREKYDHLPADQRDAAIEADQNRQRALDIEQQRQTEVHLQELREREESDRFKQADAERQRQLKASETPVTIADNQILVPVAFFNSGREATVHLVMDTGATHTVLYRSVASQLNIYTLSKGQSTVAGGRSVQSETGKVDSIRVGPITAKDFPVVILPFEGDPSAHSGLLGMDFLRRVEYSIDYDQSVIRWKLRSR